jgi:hypothetical protein
MKIGSVPSYTIFASILICAVAAGAAPRGDADGDGKLSLTEFQTLAQKRLLRADKNVDGKLSLDEWLARPAAAKGKTDPSKIFTRFDANGDSLLDRAEIDALAKRRFARLDKNADGVITDEERSVREPGAAKNNADGVVMDEEQSTPETGAAKN